MTQATKSLEDVADLGPQMIYSFDLQGVCTLSVGPGLAGMGLKPGQLVGQNLFDLYTEPDIAATLRRALTGESFTIRNNVDGLDLRTTFEPVHGSDGAFEGVVAVCTDLTDYERAREDLTRFKALADDSPNLISIMDDRGQLSYVNPRLAELLNLTSSTVWATAEALVGENQAEELHARVRSGERWSGDLVLHLPTGEMVVRGQLFPLHDAIGDRQLGTGWIAQDITELRAANTDLKQFRALVDASSDFIAIAGLDGSVRYVNPAGRSMVGTSADADVSTTTISDYLTPDGIERSQQVEQPAVMKDGRWHGESTLRCADGSAVPVEISSFVVPDPDTGEPSALATVQRDISARLAAAKTQKEFVALVAHELRTPLTSVKGYIEIACESLEHPVPAGPAQLAAQLKVATRNIVRMEKLVEQILSVAGENRHRDDRRRRSDLVTLVTEAVESARPGVEAKGLEFTLTTCEPLHLTLDEAFVEVVDNLVSNAAKYTPSGGRVDVALSREGHDAVLVVADTGAGIAPSERELIFEKFVRGDLVARQTIPGLGLGLFITREIVQSHGGRISVGDRPGGGTRFEVRLPLTPAPAPQCGAPDQPT
ncbi:ATP-binding protein [Nocardioides sp.]|uniref:ATP-binding protein n=1 Tax=Nocardioides sp. TaxID=35761 RepID=UPI002B269012|nr:ATP-binding protein [Nocardioides sp.]